MNKIIEVDFLPRESGAFELGLPPTAFGISDARRVLIVDNDARAHLTARNFRPDLILLDVVMPERDGGEIAAQIHADPELHGTPIIFLTALVTRAEAKTGLHIDGHPFLAKPINIQELINAIEARLPTRPRAFG